MERARALERRRAILDGTFLVLVLGFGGCAHAATPVSRLCRPDATVPAQGAAISTPETQPSPIPFSRTRDPEETIGTLVGEPVAGSVLRYEDVVATGPLWLFTNRGLAVGKIPLQVIVGQKTAYGWKAFVQESACFEEAVPAAVLEAGPRGYEFASAWRYGAAWYTLWNKRSGYETLLIAIAPQRTGPASVQKLATLPLKAKALSIRPPLQDSWITLIMAGSKPQDPAVYLLQLSYKPQGSP